MPTLSAGSLRTMAADIFAALGAPRADAETVASVLVEANLLGHDVSLPSYSYGAVGALEIPDSRRRIHFRVESQPPLQRVPGVCRILGNVQPCEHARDPALGALKARHRPRRRRLAGRSKRLSGWQWRRRQMRLVEKHANA